MPRLPPLLAVIVALAMLQPARAVADAYPERPIRIVAGNLAGGQSDRIARLVAQYLEALWAVPVVVEDRAGADGTIAAEFVARAAPDGCTLLLAGQSNLVLVTAQGRQLRYDAVSDFAPIGRVASVPLALVVNAGVPATTITELIALARARPGALTYGSSGIQSRLAAELFKVAEHLDILEIPYKGNAPALADLLAGRIDMMFYDISVAAPHAESGALRLLAAAGARRAAIAPSLPTLAELGIRGFRVEPWYGLVAPAGTPPEILARLRSGLAEVRRMPEVRERLDRLGYEPFDDSPEQFAADIVRDIERFSAVVKAAGLKSVP